MLSRHPRALVVAALISAQLAVTPPRQAHAVVAAVAGALSVSTAIPILVAGVMGTAGGNILNLLLTASPDGNNPDFWTGLAIANGIGIVAILTGIALLPETSMPQFTRLSPESIHQLGLSEEDVEAYHSELSELNALLEEWHAQLSSLPTIEQAMRSSQSFWSTHRGLLSEGTQRVTEALARETASAWIKPAR